MSTEIIKAEQTSQAEVLNFFNKSQFETMQRVAMVFVNSDIVPERYRISQTNSKDKAIGNTLIAIEMASRIGASPLMVMQNLYVVHGSPGWSAKFLIATINTCGRFEPLRYKMTNIGKTKFQNTELDNWECIAYTTKKGDDEVMESTPVDIAMAIAEGWYGKNGSKWKTMPMKMLRYRAASFWTNEFAPEISMGMHSAEEIEDITYEEIPKQDTSVKVREEIKNNANGQTIGIDAKSNPIEDRKEATEETKPDEQKQPDNAAKDAAGGGNGTQTKAPF